MGLAETVLAAESSPQNLRIPGRRWRIALLLGLGVLVNYFDRVNLSVSHGALITAFGISDVAFGYLSSTYSFTYCLLQIPIGVILDRFGVRRVGRVGTFLWSVATFGAAVTPSLGGLFGARLLLGVGEAPTFPANAKAVGHWFPPQERSFATALFDSAAKLASAIGVPMAGLVLAWAGWRWSFAVTGFISLLYFGLFWLVYREPADDPGLTERERAYIEAAEETREQSVALGPQYTLPRLLGERKVIGLTIGYGSYNYVFYLLLYWLPSYFAYALHVDLVHSFLYTSVPWLSAAVTELAIGGWLVDALIKRGGDASRIRRVVLVAGTACGLGILGAARAHTTAEALAWITLSISGLSAAAPVAWSLPSLIGGRSDAGKVGGIINFSGQVSSIGASILTGYLVSALHSYGWAFRVAAIYLVIGIAGYIFLLGKIEPLRGKFATN